jgi:hypothetical protein
MLGNCQVQLFTIRQDNCPFRKNHFPLDSDEVQARFPGCIKIGQSIPYKEAVPGYKPVVGQKIADMIRFFDYNTPTTSLFPENN